MEIFLYIVIFTIGIVFGSFYTLALYRIPRKQDITHTHSYCPKCNHKLGALDLIPLLSYLFLGGKCHYCKEKIRPRYFFVELLSGIVFVGLAYVLQIAIETITITKIVQFGFMALYITFVILIAGIDKEEKNINRSVLAYGIIISLFYMIYLCIVEKANIYRYGIYCLLDIILLVLDTKALKKHAKDNYVYGILLTLIVMIIFTSEMAVYQGILITLLAICLYILVEKIKRMKRKNKKTEQTITENLPVGFFLGAGNLISFFAILISYQIY